MHISMLDNFDSMMYNVIKMAAREVDMKCSACGADMVNVGVDCEVALANGELRRERDPESAQFFVLGTHNRGVYCPACGISEMTPCVHC